MVPRSRAVQTPVRALGSALSHWGRRFGVVGADQRWTSNGENEFGFAVDAVDPADIAAARPGYPLFDADRAGHSRSIASNFIGLLTAASAATE